MVDSFLLTDKSSGQKREFSFVHFGTMEEPNRAVTEGNGRSFFGFFFLWGGGRARKTK